MECDEHVSRQCPLTIVNCEFRDVGCEKRLPRCEMTAHLSSTSTTTIHLSLVVSTVSNMCNSMYEQAQDIKALRTVTNKLDRLVKESTETVRKLSYKETNFDGDVSQYIQDITDNN